MMNLGCAYSYAYFKSLTQCFVALSFLQKKVSIEKWL